MQRWVSVLLGVGVVVIAVLLAAGGLPNRRHVATTAADADTLEAATVAAAGADSDSGGAPSIATVGAAEAGLAAPVELRTGIGMRMPDGTPVPPLPDKPSRVHFGVVLVAYAGAQGAPEHARSQRDAHDIADKLAADAKTDFHGAVVRGDSGSVDDVGSMPRGILEPAVEYGIFTLPVGGVSDVLETPRGYWIVKRTE
jgi:hypothetical protein